MQATVNVIFSFSRISRGLVISVLAISAFLGQSHAAISFEKTVVNTNSKELENGLAFLLLGLSDENDSKELRCLYFVQF